MRSTRPSHSKQRLRTLRYVGLFGLLLGLLPAVALAAPPSPLDPASPGARSIAELHYITLVMATIVFLIVCGLLIYSLIRFRRKSSHDPEPDQSFHGNSTLEVIWTVVPVGILATLLVLTYQTLQDTDPNRPTQMTVATVEKQANASAQGEIVFDTSGCVGCHTVNDKGGKIGPDLTKIYTDKGPDYIKQSILEPNVVIATACPTGSCPSNIMPQNFKDRLTEDDINNIIEYLKAASGAAK